MKPVYIAWKNLSKHRNRFITTVSLLSFGVCLFIIYGSFIDGFVLQSIDGLIDEEIAHIRIRNKEYDEDFPLSIHNVWIDRYNKLSRLKSIQYTERLEIMGELDNYEDTLPVKILGVNPKTDALVHTMKSLSDNAVRTSILIGSGLAKNMNLKEDNFINLTFRDRTGSYVSLEYEIGGIISSRNSQFSDSTVIVNIDELHNILGEKIISYYSIKGPNKHHLRTIVSKIKLFYPNNEVLTWKEMTDDFSLLIAQKTKILYWFYLIIAVISFLGLMNSLLISVWEKRRLTGMLRSIGYFDREIISFFLWEGLLVAVISSLIGSLFAVLFNIPLVYFGINYGDLVTYGDGSTMDLGFYIPPVVYSTWNLRYFIIPIVLLPLSSLVISYFPALKSVNMSIVECIKNKD